MFHENHERVLINRLRALDQLFVQALADLSPTEDGRLFSSHRPDATPSQRRVLADYVAQLRFLVRRFIRVQALRDANEAVSALWSFRVALSFAQKATTELLPRYLQGYGSLEPEPVEALERLVAELRALLRRMGDYLERGEGGELAARLAQLDGTRDEVGLLRELERIITAHGLVELRVTLEQLVQRAAAPRLEIAVFGRVNAGKSSLLNWWLEQSLLPTGVTPITAVPTRILHGPAAQVRVTMASTATTEVPLSELSTYVSEAGNAANHRRVLDIEIRLPAARLLEGVCLVDTPGLGSLAETGAAQTLDYLPRCDLGVLLIEAGAALNREDLDVARALLDSGSDVVITLSKADRLGSTELAQALAYVSEQLRERLHVTLGVLPISIVPPHTALIQRWFDLELVPRLAARREQAAAALRRKTAVLRELVITLLEAQLASGAGTVQRRGGQPGPTTAVYARASQARAELERVRSELLSMDLQTGPLADRIIDAAADALLRAWMSNDAAGADQQVLAAIAGSVEFLAEGVAGRLKQLREELRQVLIESDGSAPSTVELPSPRGCPVFDTRALSLSLHYLRPRGLGTWRPLLHAQARQRFGATVRASIERQLLVHGFALRHWASQYVHELSLRFDEAMAAREGAERIGESAAPGEQAASVLRVDLNRLRRWRSLTDSAIASASPS